MQASKIFIFSATKAFLVALFCIVLTGCAEKTPEQIQKENKQKTEQAVNRARVLLFENNPEAAAKLLEDASKNYETSATLLETLANAYIQSGRVAEAATLFEAASDRAGGDADLQIMAAKAYEQSGSMESAARAYEKYLKLRPQDAVVWKTFATIQENLRHFESAMNALMTSIKVSGRNPNSAEAAKVGNIFLKLGNIQQAKLWLNAALEATAPDNVKTRTAILKDLLTIKLAEKDMDGVEKTMLLLDKIDKKIVDETYPELRAQMTEFKRSLEEAKLALEKKKEEEKKAEEEKTKKLEEEAKLAEKKKLEEEKKLAEEKKDAEKKSEKSEEKLENAEKLKDEKDLPKAEEILSFVERSNNALAKGENKNAEILAHKAVAEDPDAQESWTALAKAYFAQDKANDAYLASTEALNRTPDDIDATLFNLKCASKVLSNESFLNRLYSAREKFPRNAEILIGIARTYREMKDKKNASFFYKKFLADTAKTHPRYEEIEKEFATFEAEK